MRRDVMRTCGSGRSDSSIIGRLPLFRAHENAPHVRWPLRHRKLSPSGTSGDNIRRVGIEEQLDPILQMELAPLQTRELQLVDRALRDKRRDLLVERAVLGPQLLELGHGIVIVHPGRECNPEAALHETQSRHRRPAPFARRTVRWIKTNPTFRDLLCESSVATAKGMAPMDKAQVESLESKHHALHALIDEEEHRPHPDEDLLHRLKKEKLRIKD